MDESEALAIVEKAWACWAAGDLDGLLGYFNPDGVLITTGRSPVSGPARRRLEERGHAGTAQRRDANFFGTEVNCAARPELRTIGAVRTRPMAGLGRRRRASQQP
jgi:ketosteroid isomerase-like protein